MSKQGGGSDKVVREDTGGVRRRECVGRGEKDERRVERER